MSAVKRALEAAQAERSEAVRDAMQRASLLAVLATMEASSPARLPDPVHHHDIFARIEASTESAS